jgi:integrase
MARKALTDRFIKSAKRVPSQGRKDYPDSQVPGLALRVTAAGHRSFVLVARYPLNPKNPTRRAIGDYGAVTLDKARETARDWTALIHKDIDPRVHEERQREAERRQREAELRLQTNTFAAVAAEFIERHVKGPALVELERLAGVEREQDPKLGEDAALAKVRDDPKNRDLVQRSKHEGIVKKADAQHTINSEFVKRWGAKPVTEISSEECAPAIRAIVKRGSPAQARNALGYLSRLFSWAIGTHEFGITTNPAAALRPADLIGEKKARARVLTDDELRAVWKVTSGGYVAPKPGKSRVRRGPKDADMEMGHPYGPLIRLLVLTGQREREVADMQWSEVDFENRVWTIPAERMKSDRAHVVPLAPDALALLRSLPRFTGGDYVFTTTSGRQPVNGFSKAKSRLDRLSGVNEFVFHDLRRTTRTHFSALPVQDMVREIVIAHARPELHKVYDQHSYVDEKRECLTLWEARLRGILAPKPPAEIVQLRRQA